MFAKIATKYTAKFSDVIQAIENNDDARLKHFKEAGVLSSKIDPNGHCVLLHYLTQLSDPSKDAALINSHISYFAQQCPAEIWEQFKSCALHVTKTQNYETLKRLIQSYSNIKLNLQQRDIVELHTLYSDIFSLIIHRKPGDDNLYELLGDAEDYYSADRSKLESSQVIDCLLEWSYINAFPWALKENRKALYSALEYKGRKSFIFMNVFEYCVKHFLDRQRKAIVSLYKDLYLSVALSGFCVLLEWLNRYKGLIDAESFQSLLISALERTNGIYSEQIKLLINNINNLNCGLLLNVFVKTINDIQSDIDHKNYSCADNTTIINNDPELICDEVNSIEFLLQTARKKRVFTDVLRSTIDTLKKTKGAENLEKNMKLLLVALSLHYIRPSTSAALSTIDIQDLSLNDTQVGYLIAAITSIHKQGSNFGVNNPCIPTSLNLSGNDCLGYYSILALSQLVSESHFTCINLSNNSMLGCGSNRKSCLQTFLTLLNTSKTLHTLRLKNTNFGDGDFLVLVRILETDSTLTNIDLSENKSLTLGSEIVFMELLLKRNKLKLPLLISNLAGTDLNDCNVKYFLSKENKDSHIMRTDGELIEQFKELLQDKKVLPKKRASHLNGIVLEAARTSRSNITLTELSLTDDEGTLLIQQFSQYSHLHAPVAPQIKNSEVAKSDSHAAYGSDTSTHQTLQMRFSLSLSSNSLGYRFLSKLSECFNGGYLSLAILDLSNNPKLGGGTFYSSSGVQLLAKSLAKNSTLQKLILAACGVNDKDLKTLVRMLTVNTNMVVLDLSQNNAITREEIKSSLLTLYKHRYKQQLRALRPRLDQYIDIRKSFLGFLRSSEPSAQTIFHQNIRAHIEQLRLHSLGVQFKTQKVEVHHGSVWDTLSHILHLLVLVSSTAGVVLGVLEILKTMKFALHNFNHGFHKTEEIIEVFEKLYVSSMGLKIILDIIAQIRQAGSELSDELYWRYQKHGFTETMMRTLWDFIYYLFALFQSEHKADLLVFFKKFDQLAIAINTDKVAAELAHNFSDCERQVNNPFEVELLADAVAQHFNQFCYDSHVMIDWSCVAQEFSHWILAKEPVSSEVVKIDRGLVIFTGDEDTHRELRDQSDDEWAIDVIRRRGFRCYGNSNQIIDFNVKYKTSGDNNKHEWITTDGDRFGYYPIGQKFLEIIQEKIQGYKKENAETRLIKLDKVGVEYEISAEEMERLSHHTLAGILSEYQPTEEQLRNIQDAITDLRAKTEENAAEIARVKQRVDGHATKHQQTDERLEKLEGRGQSTANSQDEITDKDIKINVLEKRVGALESENIILKRKIEYQQDTITKHESVLENLTAIVDALVGQQGQAIAVANNAALNADIAGRRADGQEVLVQEEGQRNNNQREGDPEDGVQGLENAPGDQAQGQESSQSSFHFHANH